MIAVDDTDVAGARATVAPPQPISTATSGANVSAEWQPLEALDAIVQDWRALAARALEPNVFYEPAFALSAARVFGRAAGAVLVWADALPRRLVGVFPVAIARRRYGFGVPVLIGWTHPYAPLGVPLIDREAGDAAIAAFLDHVSENPALPKILLMPFIPLHGAFAAAFARALDRRRAKVARFGMHARALLAPGNERVSYVERTIGGKRRKELRRQRRRLEDAGPIEVTTAATPSAVHAALADFLTLETRGWKGRAGTAIAEDPAVRQFVETAIADLASLGMARVDRLAVGGRPIAAAITLRSQGTAWFWKIAYDETVARASPGVQLTLALTQALLTDATIERVDSCATADHPMIDHLWGERLALADWLVTTRPQPAAAFALAMRLEALRGAATAAARRLRALVRRR